MRKGDSDNDAGALIALLQCYFRVVVQRRGPAPVETAMRWVNGGGKQKTGVCGDGTSRPALHLRCSEGLQRFRAAA